MLLFSMGSVIQKENGELNFVEDVDDINSIIQMVQLSNGKLASLSSLSKNDLVLSFKNRIQKERVKEIQRNFVNELIYLKLKNGLFIVLPKEFKVISTLNSEIISRKVSELNKGDFIAIPNKYCTSCKKIKFDVWDLDDFLFIYGIKGWYSKNLENLMKTKKLLIKDVAKNLDVPYWKVRRNALSKDSINYGFIKKFIRKYLKKEDIYGMISISKGFKNEKSAGKYAKSPLEYKEELSYLNAILVGEGHIVKNEKQAILEFADIEFTEVLKNLIKKIHGYQQKGNRINLPGFLAYFYSRFLKVPKGNKSKIVPFPPLALQSNNEVLLGAIRGIIDGEGNVNIDNRNISITTSSFKLVLGVISSLLRLGVSCSIRKSNKDSTWNICINQGCINNFGNKIKFLRCPKKNDVLLKIKEIESKERIIIPNVGNYIRKLREEKGISSIQLAKEVGLTNTSPIEKSGNFSLESLIKINNVLNSKKISELIEKDLRWNKVIDIKNIKKRTEFIFPKTNGYFALNHIFVKS